MNQNQNLNNKRPSNHAQLQWTIFEYVDKNILYCLDKDVCFIFNKNR
jgi:hypothetical protein